MSTHSIAVDRRKEKGAAIAAAGGVSYTTKGYKVESQSGKGSYLVSLDRSEWICNCPDAQRGHKCKHQRAVTIFCRAEIRAARAALDGTLPSLQSSTLATLCQPAPAFISDCFMALWLATQRACCPASVSTIVDFPSPVMELERAA